MPGQHVATDFHLTERSVQLSNILPWTWKETAVADGLGEYYPLSLWSQPIHTIFGFFVLINIPFEVQTKLFGLIILILGFWGMWKLLGNFKIENLGKTIGSIFFILNSFFLLLFDGGQLSLALAYCILPIAVFYFLKAIETDFLKDKLKFALWVLILSISDIRIVYLLLIIIFVFMCFKLITGLENPKLFLKRIFLVAIITTIIFIGFHMYWILPSLISQKIQLPPTYGRVTQVSFLSFSSLGHSLLLQSPHWPQNIFGRLASPGLEFIFIPFLAFSTLILVKKNKIVGFWLLVSLISIFLSKGSNEPFGQIYSFLFTNIPGFSLFRDPSKFYFLTAFSYSILLGFFTDRLSKIKLLPFLLIFYFIFLARPIILGQMSGLFSQPLFQKEFQTLEGKIKDDTSFSRVFWISATAPLGYVSPEHPAVPADRLSQKRPFAAGTKGTYETFNFLREASYMGEIFDVAGIGYIAYPYLDPKRDNLHPDNIKYYYTFLDQLSKRPWLSFENSGIPLFKTKEHQDRFFITPKLWWVLGSDSIYNDATKSVVLKLSKNALIFPEENAGLGVRLDEFPEAKIVLNNKTELDLGASFINPKDLIFPAKSLNFDPAEVGWWKREAADLLRWRSFLQDKYGLDNQDFDLGGGWAVGEGNLELEIRNLKLEKDKILLARVMESTRSGYIKFYQGDQKIGEVSTKFGGDANVRWFEAGKLIAEKELTIVSEGDINVVNALAVLDQNEWVLFQDKVKKLQGRIVNFSEIYAQSNNNPEATYQRLNSTKYKVKISNLTQPAFLIFSQNYDALWKMNGQTPLPVYSLLNGFKIQNDGEYTVEFEPQKYVYPGLVISGLTLAVLVLLLLI